MRGAARRRVKSRVRRIGVGALALAGGCTLAPRPEAPAMVVELPPTYDAPSSPDVAAEPAPAGWWRGFGAPDLDRLVEVALARNLDLREAVARLEELRHRYRIARAPLFPAVSLNADANQSSSPANTGLGSQFGGEGGDGGFGFAFPDRFDFTTYSASLGFSYELDFWGRVRSESGAAVRDFLASRGDAETVRLTVIASTISTYLEIAAARAQLALAAENVDMLRERAELSEERHRAGLATTFELYAIRQQHRAAEAELPGLRTALDDAEGRLAIIVGRYAGGLGDLLPAALEPEVDLSPMPAGVTASLLEARPDVAAAHERMEAARMRVGARRAELLPTITLNGSGGFQSSDVREVLAIDQWFMNLIGGITAPIFQGGRLRANLGAAGAQYDQAAIAYVRTVLTAYGEVRLSLRRFENERQRYAQLERQVADAQASLEDQLERYRNGVGTYVEYLDARLNLNNALAARVLAERGVGEARLAVHRALGGTWTERELEDVDEW